MNAVLAWLIGRLFREAEWAGKIGLPSRLCCLLLPLGGTKSHLVEQSYLALARDDVLFLAGALFAELVPLLVDDFLAPVAPALAAPFSPGLWCDIVILHLPCDLATKCHI